MEKTNMAITLYTLREYCRTLEDLDETLRKVAAIGYKAIQVSGFTLPWADVKKLIDKYGLQCVATHESADSIINDPQAIISKLRTLECTYAAQGYPGSGIINPDGLAATIEKLEKACTILEKEGITYAYHNHAMEFEKVNGSLFYEQIFDKGPAGLEAEIDVCWVARGGGDPAWWIRHLAGKVSVLHMKDFTIVDNEPVLCEVGEGNLNWPAIITSGLESGTQWFVVELDTPFKDRDIFESIEISYKNMKKSGLH